MISREVLIQNLLDAIAEVVSTGGPWREKRDEIFGSATEDQKTALIEFISWFPEEEEEK
jgi:hypothetical protein